jgi:hypothetical protein
MLKIPYQRNQAATRMGMVSMIRMVLRLIYWSGLPASENLQAEPKTGNPKNKPRIRGAFLAAKFIAAKPPSSPHKPPQIHHQNTTFCHPFLPKPPAKTPIHHAQKKSAQNPISEPLFHPSGDGNTTYFALALATEESDASPPPRVRSSK